MKTIIFHPRCLKPSSPFTRLLPVLVLTLLFINAPHGRGDAWGIDLPAQFGKWALAIQDQYTQQQRLVNGLRQTMIHYLQLTAKLDMLATMAEQDHFRETWRRHVRVLLVANIAYEVNEEILQDGSGKLLQKLAGLSEARQGFQLQPPLAFGALLSLSGADEDLNAWVGSIDLQRPAWHHRPADVRHALQRALRDPQWRNRPLGDVYDRLFEQQVAQPIRDNPAYFLLSPGNGPNWSPFEVTGGQARTPQAWLTCLFDHTHALHREQPLAHEKAMLDGDREALQAYWHRRVCAHIYRELGRQIHAKIDRLTLAVGKRKSEIEHAVNDVRALVAQFENHHLGLDRWQSDNVLAEAIRHALAHSLDSGVSEAARRQSVVLGYVKRKLEVVLRRAEEVHHLLDDHYTALRRLQETMQRHQQNNPDPAFKPALAKVNVRHHFDDTLTQAPMLTIFRDAFQRRL